MSDILFIAGASPVVGCLDNSIIQGLFPLFIKIRSLAYFCKRLIGHTDPSLTEVGFKQANALLEYFKDEKVDYIYASEYLRVQQTAEPLARDKKISIKVDKRLNEIDNGLIETMSDEDIKKEYPEFWRDFFEHKHDCRFPEGETVSVQFSPS